MKRVVVELSGGDGRRAKGTYELTCHILNVKAGLQAEDEQVNSMLTFGAVVACLTMHYVQRKR